MESRTWKTILMKSSIECDESLFEWNSTGGIACDMHRQENIFEAPIRWKVKPWLIPVAVVRLHDGDLHAVHEHWLPQ